MFIEVLFLSSDVYLLFYLITKRKKCNVVHILSFYRKVKELYRVRKLVQ